LDYGLNVGFSYVINEMLEVSAGYTLGFADLNIEDQGDDDLSMKTNGILFSVGYLFGGGY